MRTRQIVLDTETTGLRVEEGHRLIEIGCVELINRKLTGNTFHVYINPQREIDAGATAVHGITSEALRDKPLFETIAQEFITFISSADLIIHNASFDLGFLNHELSLCGKNYPVLSDFCHVIDTLMLARQRHAGQRNSLDALCKRYGIDNSKREYHGALLDAHLLAHVYLAMTGGQGSMFDGEANSTTTESVQQRKEAQTSTSEVHDLPILRATADELEGHRQYLAMLAKKGQCQWE